MASSGGRLSPFTPVSDDHGVDLVVVDKETGQSVQVQVKAWLATESDARRTVQFDLRKATYRADETASVLIAVVLDARRMNLDVAWLIPMKVVPKIATEQTTKYALTPSRSPSSRDRYSPYRHLNAGDLAKAVLKLLNE